MRTRTRAALVDSIVSLAIANTAGAQQMSPVVRGLVGGYLAPGGVNPGYYQGPGVTYGHASPGYFGGYNSRAAQPGLYGNSGVAFNVDGVPLNPGTTGFGALGYGGSAYAGNGYYGFTPYYPRAGYRPPYLIFPQPRPRLLSVAVGSSTAIVEAKIRRPPTRSTPVQVWSRDGSRPAP